MSKGLRIGIVWVGTVAVSMTGIVAPAQGAVDEHFRSHALRYAGMIERAYGRLNGHIRQHSAGAVSWSGAAVPPAATGWEAVWTEAGLRARYCDDVLLVYMGAAEVKGVGREHRAIQQARRSYLPERERGVKLPMLSWLESGEVVDAHGAVRTLQPCMTASYTEPLPSGRAALAGDVVDPWTDVRERVSYENVVERCAAGEHGEVRKQRTVTRSFNARGEEVGTPVHGAWTPAPGSWCRADYTYHEAFTRPCSWYQGEPFNREMEGTETWRMPVRVSADPDNPAGGTRRTPGESEFVSSTCWGTPPGAVPVPSSSHEYFTEAEVLSCPVGMSGRIDVARQRITTTTTYPWGEEPLVTVDYTNWSEASNTCARDWSGGDGGESDDDWSGDNNSSVVDNSDGSDGSATEQASTQTPGQAPAMDIGMADMGIESSGGFDFAQTSTSTPTEDNTGQSHNDGSGGGNDNGDGPSGGYDGPSPGDHGW